jgi:hypothetical protein
VNASDKNKTKEVAMNANEYAEKIVGDFITDITDHLFLSIERDDEVMRDYMTNVNRYGLDTLNKAIGLKIKERLNLENDGENGNPKSKLIKSCTRHKIPDTRG